MSVKETSAWVRRFAPLIRAGGPVLDLACGGGRHARLLAGLGHPVTAVDRAPPPPEEGLEIIQANLEDGSPWPLPGWLFAGIVVTNYLHRPLFPHILAALEADGIVIYETFAKGNEVFGRPSNPNFLLDRGELPRLLAGLTVVAYEDGIVEGRAVVQRICAARGDGLYPL